MDSGTDLGDGAVVTEPGALGVPHGWYDDPWVPGGQRWWDGQAWTELAQAPVAVPDHAPVAEPDPVPLAEVEQVQVADTADDLSGGLPAGWYVDANGESRWWDGDSWTEHVSVAAVAGVAVATAAEEFSPVVTIGANIESAPSAAETAVASSPEPESEWPAAWYPDPDVPSLLRWWDGTAWTGYAFVHRQGDELPPPPVPVAVVASAAAVVAPEVASISRAEARAEGTQTQARPRGLGRAMWSVFAVCIAASLVLFFFAWKSASHDVPSTPSINVVDTPTPVTTPVPATDGGSPAPSLSIHSVT